jgi:hypothetical protein
MRQLKNHTEEEILDVINVVINRICAAYVIPGYELEDIKQQGILICLEALERYDEIRPLENFLSHNLSNRLKNFVRDNFFLKDDPEGKKKLYKPLPIEECNDQYYEDKKCLDTSRLLDIIDSNLPIKYRQNYLKLLNDVYIPKQDKQELISVLRSICEENGFTGDVFYDS